jgi:hypothetical protein
MASSSSYRPHSAQVSMRLLVNGSALRIAQMGPDFLLVDSELAHGPSVAVIRMRVDASERQWEVNLPNGIAAGKMQPVVVTLPVGQTARGDAEFCA